MVMPRRLPTLPAWLIAGLVVLACSYVSLAYTRFNGGVALLWLSGAFMMPWLATRPTRDWWPSLLGGGAALATTTVLVGAGPYGLPLAALSMAESALAVLALRRLRQLDWFGSVDGIAAFVGIAAIAVPAATALPAAFVAHLALGMPLLRTALDWFAAHALGAIALTPIVVVVLRRLSRADPRTPRRWFTAEGTMLMLALAVSVHIVFTQNVLPLLFAPLLPMVIATLRLGRAGAAGSIVVISVIAGAMTASGRGPITLIDAPPAFLAQFLQFYIAVAALVVLPIAALLAQRKVLLARLSASEATYRTVAESSSDAMLSVALDGTIVYASPAVRMAGLQPHELVGRNARDFVYEADRPAIIAAHQRVLAEPHTTVTVEYRIPMATTIGWFELRTRAVVGEDGRVTGVISVVRDIDARKAAEAELARAATTDTLTGLLNRRAFMAALERRPASGQPARTLVAMLDIDHFKAVNDRWGHAAGDTVLRAFAATARQTLRSSDLIGRIGGEEFAVLLHHLTMADAVRLCDRLRDALRAARIEVAPGEFAQVTVSIGLSLIADEDATTALENADRALYVAKRAGRDCLKLAA